jgi:chromosome segregation ATPase
MKQRDHKQLTANLNSRVTLLEMENAALIAERDVALAQVAKFIKDNNITHNYIERLVAESATLTGERDAARSELADLHLERELARHVAGEWKDRCSAAQARIAELQRLLDSQEPNDFSESRHNAA